MDKKNLKFGSNLLFFSLSIFLRVRSWNLWESVFLLYLRVVLSNQRPEMSLCLQGLPTSSGLISTQKLEFWSSESKTLTLCSQIKITIWKVRRFSPTLIFKCNIAASFKAGGDICRNKLFLYSLTLSFYSCRLLNFTIFWRPQRKEIYILVTFIC